MKAYRTIPVQINQNHPHFGWCDTLSAKINNLENAVLFRMRQLMTAKGKKPEDWSENERNIVHEVAQALHLPVSDVPKYINYEQLEKVFRYHNNPDYFAKGKSMQCAQQVSRKVVQDMKNFFDSMRAWKASGVGEKPNLPCYKTKGGRATVTLTNQDCVVRTKDHGSMVEYYAKLPLIPKLPLSLGIYPKTSDNTLSRGILKEVKVCPNNGCYTICFVFEVELGNVSVSESPCRIASIDFGVNNLMAVTNNCGLPCLLYKGGIAKSINHYYNKQLAKIMSEEMSKPDCPKNKDGNPRFVPTNESRALTLERNNALLNLMHKVAKHFISWCVEQRIDTIVAGVNKGWKQEVSMGATENQNFVQIPFAKLRGMISYLAEEAGIRFIEREESYTSRASFPDRDAIPTYGVNDNEAHFSGKRSPRDYKGQHRAKGFHGLYQCSDGSIINADLNGSANILRKEFPHAFEQGTEPDFTNVRFVNAKELGYKVELRPNENKPVSKSKQKRLAKKARKKALKAA